MDFPDDLLLLFVFITRNDQIGGSAGRKKRVIFAAGNTFIRLTQITQKTRE